MRSKAFLKMIMAGGLMASSAVLAADFLRITAGEDQSATVNEPVSLSGTVNKSASIGWGKIEGPGDVVFREPHSAETTASFSEPGEYLLMLSGYDGDIAYDHVRITVNR